jgi:hypothetical protein
MKILHLVLYSHGHPNHFMRLVSRIFYKTLPDVDTFFYCFDKVDDDYLVNEDLLVIKGGESRLGILDKTIKALEYFDLNKYDYVVRSNVSTIVDFVQLNQVLSSRKIEYGGGYINKLKWLDPESGIVDDSHHGLYFASGTCIILSQSNAKKLVAEKEKLNYNVVDDVSIAIFFKEHNITPEPICTERFWFVNDLTAQIKPNYPVVGNGYELTNDVYKVTNDIINTTIKLQNHVYFRNRSLNRDIDINNMIVIVSALLQKYQKK